MTDLEPAPRWTAPTAPVLPPNGQLTVDEALFMAIARNPDLAARRLLPEQNAERVRIEEAGFSPEFFANVQVAEETASETARSTGERFAVEAEGRQTEIGHRKDFVTGTEAELFVREGRDASNRAPTQQDIQLGLELTQPLLQGAGSTVNRISVRQAELGVRVSEEELRAYTQALLSNAETHYWQVALAAEGVEITRQALEVAEQQLEEVQARIEVGRLPRNQQAAAEAEVALRRQNLIEAEAERDRQHLRLLNVISLPAADTTVIATSPVDLTEFKPGPLDPWIAAANELRPDLREARTRLAQNRLEVVRTQNGLQPRLDFFASLAKTGFGEDMNQAQSAFGEDTYEWTAGLRLLHSLGRESEKARDRLAALEVAQTDLAIQNLEQQAETEVRLAWVDLKRARNQIEAGKVTLRLREATLQAERDRFEVGDATSLDVAQAQRDLLESRLNLLRARIAIRSAWIDLHTASGKYLSSRGIEILP
jgi:outer membrane protein TolC